jgi:hypothetical protein
MLKDLVNLRRFFQGAGLGLLLAMVVLQVPAQTQSFQTWPEIDTYLKVSSNVRVSFLLPQRKRTARGRTPRLDQTSIFS